MLGGYFFYVCNMSEKCKFRTKTKKRHISLRIS